MKRVILVRYGEINLKGLNRSYFINMLLKNIKISLKNINIKDFKVEKIQDRFIVHLEEEDMDKATEDLRKIFRIVSISLAYVIENHIDTIKKLSLELMNKYQEQTSFKVQTRRTNKGFPIQSMD